MRFLPLHSYLDKLAVKSDQVVELALLIFVISIFVISAASLMSW